jgi:hypothetical protein
MSLDLRGPANPALGVPQYKKTIDSPSKTRFAWNWIWPKALAVGLVLLLWQYAIWTEWRQPWVLPSPGSVFDELWHEIIGDGRSGISSH